jgi:hypothetical protein
VDTIPVGQVFRAALVQTARSDWLFWRLDWLGAGKSVEEMFESRHFSAEVIILCVRWYL